MFIFNEEIRLKYNLLMSLLSIYSNWEDARIEYFRLLEHKERMDTKFDIDKFRNAMNSIKS